MPKSDTESDDFNDSDLEEQLELAAYEEMMAAKNKNAIAPALKSSEKRTIINNTQALDRRARDLDLSKIAGFELAFSDILAVTAERQLSEDGIEGEIFAPTASLDHEDDLNRELGFYQQALAAVIEAQRQLAAENIPFTRPDDYFAEMVKSDHQMMKIRQRLVDESQSIKKSEEAKKQRELRKFGKSIQVQKLQERQKAKADTLDKISSLKRKRKNGGNEDTDANGDLVDPFEVLLEEDKPRGNKDRKFDGNKNGRSNRPVVTNKSKKDAKFGFGGKKRNIKSNTKSSTDDFEFSPRKNKALPKGFRGASKPQKSTKLRLGGQGKPGGGKRR